MSYSFKDIYLPEFLGHLDGIDVVITYQGYGVILEGYSNDLYEGIIDGECNDWLPDLNRECASLRVNLARLKGENELWIDVY